MKVAVIGSRNITSFNLADIIPQGTTEIVSGGAKGIDSLAQQFAEVNHLPCTVFLPDYERYGRSAPLRRNDQIIAYADLVIAIWDGTSRGTLYVITRCRQLGKPVNVYQI